MRNEAAENQNSSPLFQVEKVRGDFPILEKKIYGKPLVYLDNAASTQKPHSVIESINRVYREEYANVHRGVHWLSEQTTLRYEQAREKVRHFINAKEAREIIFVKGTTEAINLVAQSFSKKHITRGDEIILSRMEHHSNIVPWQMVCEQTGAHIRVCPIHENGELNLHEFEKLLCAKTRIVSITHVSNTLGTVNPIEKIIPMAHAQGAVVLVDGAQAVAHKRVDVQALNCDFYAFSGHKLYGPSGIGVLYGKAALLEDMPPYQGGGNMIRSVSFEKTVYNDIPLKFEAGTPPIASTIGLAASIDYLTQLDFAGAMAHEDDLLMLATENLKAIPGLKIWGTAPQKISVLSFTLEGIHPHDVGTILDREGIAVRAGHHCTQPLMEFFGIPATVRASFAFYNTTEEVKELVLGIQKVRGIFHV